MSKKPVLHRAPWVWKGAASDLVFHRETGAEVVVDGDELVIEGVELAPLHRWFDRARPAWADPVARLFCRCGAGPVAVVSRIWQPGSETVALVDYGQRRRTDRTGEATMHRAVLHLGREECSHGPLLLHPADVLRPYCRRHHPALPGQVVVDAVRRCEGGWSAAGPKSQPQPARVVLR